MLTLKFRLVVQTQDDALNHRNLSVTSFKSSSCSQRNNEPVCALSDHDEDDGGEGDNSDDDDADGDGGEVLTPTQGS